VSTSLLDKDDFLWPLPHDFDAFGSEETSQLSHIFFLSSHSDIFSRLGPAFSGIRHAADMSLYFCFLLFLLGLSRRATLKQWLVSL
jgi:hypothetical protein